MLPQVPCDGAYTIWDLFEGLRAADHHIDELLKDEPLSHLFPTELQILQRRKMTFGVTDGGGKLLHP